VLPEAAFTPDTCSLDTSYIHLYRLSTSTCILFRRQNCRQGDMYPDKSCSSGILVSGYTYLSCKHCLRLSLKHYLSKLIQTFQANISACSLNVTKFEDYGHTQLHIPMRLAPARTYCLLRSSLCIIVRNKSVSVQMINLVHTNKLLHMEKRKPKRDNLCRISTLY